VARERAKWADRFRRYRVLIDDREVGRLRSGGSATFDVTPGMHVVEIRIDWTGSPELPVHVAQDETVELRCRSPASPRRKPFLTKEGWVALERVD
jgi:hypothetical protein